LTNRDAPYTNFEDLSFFRVTIVGAAANAGIRLCQKKGSNAWTGPDIVTTTDGSGNITLEGQMHIGDIGTYVQHWYDHNVTCQDAIAPNELIYSTVADDTSRLLKKLVF